MSDFLAAADLDQAQQIRDALGEDAGDGADLAARTIGAWADRQAVANLLMYPGLIPADARVPALIRALRGPDSYLRLAAAVGVGDLDDVSPTDRHALLEAALDMISDDPGLPAIRAAASIAQLARFADAADLVVLLRHPDPAVRHNLTVALIHMLGDASLADLLADRDEVAAQDAADAVRILRQDGIDIHRPASELRLLPTLPYLPNLDEWQEQPSQS